MNLDQCLDTTTIWLASDTHFDHANIIRYCNRPYRDVREMNATLMNNWNKTVKPNDLMIFLGDLTMNRNPNAFPYWMSQLNGDKLVVRGNHGDQSTVNHILTTYNGQNLLFIHNPAHAPPDFKGWTIHGHGHNKWGWLIDQDRKRANISMERTAYKPISLASLIQLINTDQSLKEVTT